jgi:hypothetical protein
VKRILTIALAVALAVAFASESRAQQAGTPACDTVIAAAKTGETQAGIFLSVLDMGGNAQEKQLSRIQVNVGNEFVPPRPFKLSVFAGPSLMPGLRAIGSDTSNTVRSLTVTGIYRAAVGGGDSVPEVSVLRRSLMNGFDSAAVTAIRGAARVKDLFIASTGSPLTFDIAFTSDSLPTSLRLFTGLFPSMPVRDATPAAAIAPLKYPELASGDSIRANVVLRFVVGVDGLVEPATLEAVRPAPLPFLKAAIESLAPQRFTPATVNGCPVAQQVDYPFAFLPSPGAPQGLTRPR